MFNKKIVFIILTITIITFLVLFISRGKNNTSQNIIAPTITPTPTIINNSFNLPEISSAPTISPDKGIDTNSQTIKNSEIEIAKIYPQLPYSTAYNLSTGITASVQIPARDLQDNPWTLSVYVFGIDYNLPSSDQNYQLMKNSFLESARDILKFLKQNGVDVTKIFISWSDKQLERSVIDQWMKQP